MSLLSRLDGSLIVSVQAEAGSPMNDPRVIAAMAAASLANGAGGLRVEGADRIAAVRRITDAPLIGIVKRSYAGFEPYITAGLREVAECAAAGADVVAFDATARERPGGTVAAMVAAIHARGALAMADCAELGELRAAAAAGADIVATTLCGYTSATRGTELPAVELLRAAAGISALLICEGGVATPADVRNVFAAGAQAVVIGTAITNVDRLAFGFAAAVRAAVGR